MNWELPHGQRVRVGERVVKSTTGFDLLRFLLGSGGRFGREVDFVLRLRPLCDGQCLFWFDGEPRALQDAVRQLRSSCWIHWLEAVDWVAEKGWAPRLRVAVHAALNEMNVYQDFLETLAKSCQITMTLVRDRAPRDGRPDFVVKTSPERLFALTEKIANAGEGPCVAMCAQAALHGYLASEENPETCLPELMASLEADLLAVGGHWFSRHLPPPLPCADERAWLQAMTNEWPQS